VKQLRAFDIDIYKLSDKKHQYQYAIDAEFFENFPNSLIEKGNLQVMVTLDKKPRLIQVDFDITGTVTLVCDRSLEPFEHPLHIQEGLIFQYGEEEKALTDEITIITKNTQKINLAQDIYEFIGLAIPMKKIHPKFRTEDDDLPFTKGSVVFTTQQDADTNNAPEATDPRWEALKKLRNN
jgi:uncharacterized metal-binding protein YceD (DUF177 family)